METGGRDNPGQADVGEGKVGKNGENRPQTPYFTESLMQLVKKISIDYEFVMIFFS